MEKIMDFKTYHALEKKAWALVAEKSNGEMRFSSAIPGQPYWTHLLEVHMAQVIGGVTDPEELLATILHDVVEDSDVTVEQLTFEYSSKIAAIVHIVSKPEPFIPATFYGNIMSASTDIRLPAMRIKVRDRINNLITNMAHNTPEKARAYVEEAGQYFMPMANQVGLTEELSRTIQYVNHRHKIIKTTVYWEVLRRKSIAASGNAITNMPKLQTTASHA